jgi:hypothetical protein
MLDVVPDHFGFTARTALNLLLCHRHIFLQPIAEKRLNLRIILEFAKRIDMMTQMLSDIYIAEQKNLVI